nr:POTRA domain, FtsQ-type [uncultured bacterium]
MEKEKTTAKGARSCFSIAGNRTWHLLPRLKAWGKVAVAVFAVGAIAASSYEFLNRSFFRVYEIDVQLEDGAEFSTIFPSIKESLDIRMRPFHGQFIWSVDLENILALVESDQRVKDAKVTRIYPDKIQIRLQPYTPVVNILDKKKPYLHPVARNGQVLPPVPVGEASDSPILRGEQFLADKNLRSQALALLHATPVTGSFSQKSISEISFDKKHGFELRLQPSGTIVWMGDEDFTHRASQVARVVDYLRNEDLTGRIIDARYGKKVVVKLRNAP